MKGPRRGKPLARMTRSTLTSISLVLLVVGAGTRTAYAGDHNGNGRHNRNSFAYNSPTINHGIQHVTNSNVGGNTASQSAFCKKWVRTCRIKERLVVSYP